MRTSPRAHARGDVFFWGRRPSNFHPELNDKRPAGDPAGLVDQLLGNSCCYCSGEGATGFGGVSLTVIVNVFTIGSPQELSTENETVFVPGESYE